MEYLRHLSYTLFCSHVPCTIRWYTRMVEQQYHASLLWYQFAYLLVP